MQVVALDTIVARGPLGVGVKDAVGVASGVGVSVGSSGTGEEGIAVGVPGAFAEVACAGRFDGVFVLGADVDGLQAEIKMDAVISQKNSRTFMNAP